MSFSGVGDAVVWGSVATLHTGALGWGMPTQPKSQKFFQTELGGRLTRPPYKTKLVWGGHIQHSSGV